MRKSRRRRDRFTPGPLPEERAGTLAVAALGEVRLMRSLLVASSGRHRPACDK